MPVSDWFSPRTDGTSGQCTICGFAQRLMAGQEICVRKERQFWRRPVADDRARRYARTSRYSPASRSLNRGHAWHGWRTASGSAAGRGSASADPQRYTGQHVCSRFPARGSQAIRRTITRALQRPFSGETRACKGPLDHPPRSPRGQGPCTRNPPRNLTRKTPTTTQTFRSRPSCWRHWPGPWPRHLSRHRGPLRQSKRKTPRTS